MMLPPIVGAFRAKHPGIQIELILSNLVLDLGKRAADVAIRPADNPPPGLVGRRVASVAFAIYAGRGYLARRGKIDIFGAPMGGAERRPRRYFSGAMDAGRGPQERRYRIQGEFIAHIAAGRGSKSWARAAAVLSRRSVG